MNPSAGAKAALSILVADSQRLFADCLAYSLSFYPGFEVLPALPSTGPQAVESAVELGPDICLLDFWIKEMEGPATTGAILSRSPGIKVVLLSWMHTSQDVPQGLAAGAAAFVPKDTALAELADIIRAVYRGEPMIERAKQAAIKESSTEPLEKWRRLRKLTPRELQILRLAAEGRRVNDMAVMLGVSPLTVRRHLHNIFSKLDARSQLEAVAIARHFGIFSS